MFNIVSRNVHSRIYSPLTRCGAHFLVTSHWVRVLDLLYNHALLVKFLKINKNSKYLLWKSKFKNKPIFDER